MANLPILVIAGNYRQFVFWCREHNIDPRNTRKAVFLGENDSARRIQGRHGNPYIKIGTFYERRDLLEVNQHLHIIEAVPLEETDG
jgi:hypothetical protein